MSYRPHPPFSKEGAGTNYKILVKVVLPRVESIRNKKGDGRFYTQPPFCENSKYGKYELSYDRTSYMRQSGRSKFFKGCVPQNLLNPLLNTLSHMIHRLLINIVWH